ncbi:hypothetical protein [Pseudoalteromonas sp. PB2-1]|uniref:hypothetical protein n=1 Tax=Pseudoalteromonas sp. PB2-1 TaxID=2907242 RepID=UPI00386E2EE3
MENKTLWESKSLWSAIIIGVAIAVWSSLAIINSTDNLLLCENSACFASFLELFDFPLKVLSAALFIAGFIAVMHRSEQTHQQIEISLKQNAFKNYIDHKAELVEVLIAFEEEYTSEEHVVEIKGKHTLYRKLFPKNSTQYVDFISHADSEEVVFILSMVEEFNKLTDKYNEFGNAYINRNMTPNQYFSRWIAEYLLLSMRLGFFFDTSVQIHSDWSGHLSPDLFKGIPEDIEKHILTFRKLLLELQHFCYPTENERVEIYFPTHYHNMNGLVHLYSQPKNYQSLSP